MAGTNNGRPIYSQWAGRLGHFNSARCILRELYRQFTATWLRSPSRGRRPCR